MKTNRLINIMLAFVLASCTWAGNGNTVAVGGKGLRKQTKPDGSTDTVVWNNEKSFRNATSGAITYILAPAIESFVGNAGEALVKGTADPNIIPKDPNIIPLDPNVIPVDPNIVPVVP